MNQVLKSMMNPAAFALVLSLTLATAPALVHAAQSSTSASSSSASGSYGLNVPVGGSIAIPGATTSTFTNPAGLVGNRGARLSFQGASPKPMDDPNYRALILAGNGYFGASAGIDYFSPNSGTKRADAVYGLAVSVPVMNLALGIAGRSGVKNSKGTDFNAGMIFMPFGMMSIGATAFGLKDKMKSYGAGLGIGLMPGIDVVIDAAADGDFKHPELKPGLKLANQFAGISVSYGTGDTDQFSKDIGAAFYLAVGSNSELEFTYNHGGDIPKYYASLSFGF